MTIHSAPCARAALAASLCLTVAMAPAVAAAQSTSLTPVSGSVRLDAGFRPDPHVVSVRAGGAIDADDASLPEDCTGHITPAATYEVYYKAGGSPLIFRTESDEDTTLLINGPDSAWTCDDDGGSGVNAEVVFESPATGTYDVWVGKLYGGTAAATLSVSEIRSSSDDEDWEDEDWDSTPEPTNISIKVCNESGRPATVAVSYIPEGDSQFATRGWFPVANGTCGIVATTTNRNFYLYGEVDDGSGYGWAGNHPLCVRYPGPFFEYPPPDMTCVQGQELRMFHPKTAEQMGEWTWTLGQ